MTKEYALDRRAFLKFLGVNITAAALPFKAYPEIGHNLPKKETIPALILEELPRRVRSIFDLIPITTMPSDGYLRLLGPNQLIRKVPVAITQWNKEKRYPADRLLRNKTWGIVLHWYGDDEDFDHSIKGYLRGFDSLRKLDDFITRTSAHFVVGGAKPQFSEQPNAEQVAILQTQTPDRDGTPFTGSHIRSINYLAHQEKKQYFVRALYQLGYRGYGTYTLLQDMFDGPVVDPNMVTIAIEITGAQFDNPGKLPGDQQIANVVATVWSIMKRYGIQSTNILGHNEIQLGKADPGKKFLALIKYLIGIRALIEQDPDMWLLVFGPFLKAEGNLQQAVTSYFRFLRDYLVLVSAQKQVYDWEAESKYWFVYDRLVNADSRGFLAEQFLWPLSGTAAQAGYTFLNPDFHAGVDFYQAKEGQRKSVSLSRPIYLAANGRCVYTGATHAHCQGKTALFRHRQSDGAEVLMVYDHLGELSNIKPGEDYPAGSLIGAIESEHSYIDPYLHFAVAYGASWDTDLKGSPENPLNGGVNWIKNRYMEPNQYLGERINSQNRAGSQGLLS